MAEWTAHRQRPRWRRWALPLGFGLLVVLAVGLGALWWLAPTLYDSSGVDPGDRAAATATTRAGILAVFAATIAALGATVALVETRRSNRESDQRERWAKAIDQLGTTGHDRVDVRLGGIYSLQRIAEDSGRDLPTVVAVLCAFVRGHGQEPEPDDPPISRRGYQQPPDVQAALTVIGGLNDPKHWRRIDLREAHIEGAALPGADLTRAAMGRAKLHGANLGHTNLSGAGLIMAKLPHAYVVGADLTGASLVAADLTDADLTRTNLTDAELTHAKLHGANLTGARGLSQDQLEQALGDENTRVPEGLTHPGQWLHPTEEPPF